MDCSRDQSHVCINYDIFYEQVYGLELNRHKRASCFSEQVDFDILFDGNVKTPGSERAVRGSGNREVVFAKTKSREVESSYLWKGSDFERNKVGMLPFFSAAFPMGMLR